MDVLKELVEELNDTEENLHSGFLSKDAHERAQEKRVDLISSLLKALVEKAGAK